MQPFSSSRMTQLPPSQTNEAYPLDLGHDANRSFKGALRMVPVDLNIPHDHPNAFTTRPYNPVNEEFMGSFWIRNYDRIPDEDHFQDNHLVPYLRTFYVQSSDVVDYPTSWAKRMNLKKDY
ncbi:hypothetical protein IAR50_000023 [Cryptococcus sp. DSM 104548]